MLEEEGSEEEGSSYILWAVTCTVYNHGGGGEIEVSATIEDGQNFLKKSSTMHLDSKEEREHMFRFRDIKLLFFDPDPPYEFDCQAIPK